MSPIELTERETLRIVAFGDPGGAVWGAALELGGEAALAAGRGRGRTALPVRINSHGAEWRLEGDAAELRAVPASEAAASEGTGEPGPAAGPRADRRCRVSGRAGELELDCPGIRIELPGAEVGRLASARGVYGFFGEGQAVALLALRPAGSAGNEADRAHATLFDADRTIAVDDPRLSTTYAAGGTPSRASLELWVREGEEEYPRRAAAEASGEPVTATVRGVELHVVPVVCHGRGVDGAGVYLLVSGS